jgi:O-antigen/teichoic acid export membrane protein
MTEIEKEDDPIPDEKPHMMDKAHMHGNKKQVIEAASFVVIGFGMSSVIRLLGNIVLTKLLVPELFGLVSLAKVFVMGLYLFSDIGLAPAVIRSDRSNDPVFLNTVWTVQIIRSAIITGLLFIIAFPVAALYKEPILKAVIPAIGLLGMINSLQSTSLIKLDRDLQQKKLTIIGLAVQVISTGCMIVAAYFFRNIWALMLSDLVGNLILVTWSFSLNKASPNRLMLEKPAIKELLSFGKWILVSTAMVFLASQADRLLLGKLFSMTKFGVYNIAVTLAELPKQIITRLSGKIFFPLIAKYSHSPREELRKKIGAPRGKMLALLAVSVAIFGSFGDFLVRILYDQRYSAAAWILPLLVVGMWPLLLINTIDGSLLAIGKSQYSAISNFAKFVYMIVLIPVSFKLYGEFGVILVVAFNDIPSYIIINYGLARENLSLLKQDAWTTLVLLVALGLFLAIRIIFGMGLPGQAFFAVQG